MCGIFIVLDKRGFKLDQGSIRLLDGDTRLMSHRGETDKKFIINNKIYIYHRRLAIMDPTPKGNQPFFSSGVFLAINGEVYNHKALRAEINANWPAGKSKYVYKSQSDCEVLIPLYLLYGTAFIRKVQGMYSFIMIDTTKNLMLVSRDHIGMTSLYSAESDDLLAFSSEMKCLTRIAGERNATINTFQPGNVFVCGLDKQSKLASAFPVDPAPWRRLPFDDMDFKTYDTSDTSLESTATALKDCIERAVVSHIQSDSPIGCLLSGGLDSSIVAAIAAKHSSTPIQTFTIGLENSVDIQAAAEMASHIKSNHTAYSFDVEDAISVLGDVITAIETYDITTVRASIPLYLLTMFIKEDTGIKSLLSGEVADEIFAGYAYFKHAPNAKELFEETVDKVNALHKYDCLRAHKAALANTIEVRVPFGHREVVDMVMSIDPTHKMSNELIEKHILREAFKDILPESIYTRKKEQFSDGVSGSGENLIDSLKEHANTAVSDEEMANAETLWPVNTPKTKEGVLYRKLFDAAFPLPSQVTTVDHNVQSIACSTPRAMQWMNISSTNDPRVDPSGRSA
jgi:asparagine synthase (glutamine-hydrolysing)